MIKTFSIFSTLIFSTALFYYFLAPVSVAPNLSGEVSRIVDGDSLYLVNHKPQIRLWGVDAPERGEGGFQEATKELYEIASGQRIACREIDKDLYDRTVARCFLSDGREINLMMIESGAAREYFKYSKGFYGQ